MYTRKLSKCKSCESFWLLREDADIIQFPGSYNSQENKTTNKPGETNKAKPDDKEENEKPTVEVTKEMKNTAKLIHDFMTQIGMEFEEAEVVDFLTVNAEELFGKDSPITMEKIEQLRDFIKPVYDEAVKRFPETNDIQKRGEYIAQSMNNKARELDLTKNNILQTIRKVETKEGNKPLATELISAIEKEGNAAARLVQVLGKPGWFERLLNSKFVSTGELTKAWQDFKDAWGLSHVGLRKGISNMLSKGKLDTEKDTDKVEAAADDAKAATNFSPGLPAMAIPGYRKPDETVTDNVEKTPEPNETSKVEKTPEPDETSEVETTPEPDEIDKVIERGRDVRL